jgi:hypothetical protein
MFCRPELPWLSFCILATYCFDTVFHAPMYFSMQFVKHFSSPEESEVPGFGTQRSKQCSFSFSTRRRAFCMAASCWIWRMICILLQSASVYGLGDLVRGGKHTGHFERQTCRSRLMSPFCRMYEVGDQKTRRSGIPMLVRSRCSFSKKLSTSRAPGPSHLDFLGSAPPPPQTPAVRGKATHHHRGQEPTTLKPQHVPVSLLHNSKLQLTAAILLPSATEARSSCILSATRRFREATAWG